MPRVRLLVLASAVAITSGCASWFPAPEEPKEPEPEELGERELDYGVSYIKPDSTIVFMRPSYQHVVLPSGATVSYRDNWEEKALEKVADRIDEEQTSGDSSTGSNRTRDQGGDHASRAPGGQPTVRVSEDERSDNEPGKSRRYRAWGKLCDERLDEITDGDYFLVTTTDIPPELAKECDPEALLALIRK